jgi:hypothetical protein
MAYIGGGQAAAAYGPGGFEELAEVLCLYATTMQVESALEAVPVIKSAVDKLAAATFRQRVQGQLEQLSGGQERLLTVQQLQYGCCCCAFKLAIGVHHHWPGQLADLTALAASSAQVLRRLEPNNPASYVWQATALGVVSKGPKVAQQVECYLQAARLGQEQRSDYWALSGAAKALHLATCCPLEVGRSSLAAALELYEQTAETALRCCKRLLPAAWVMPLGHDEQMARHLLHRVQGQLQLLRQASSRGRGDIVREARTAVLASAAAQRAAAANEHERISVQGDLGLCPAALVCNGCGELAAGLRRCARCKQAQYCRCAGAVAWLVLNSCTALAHGCYMAGDGGLSSCVALVPPSPAAASARWSTGASTSTSAAPPDTQTTRQHTDVPFSLHQHPAACVVLEISAPIAVLVKYYM